MVVADTDVLIAALERGDERLGATVREMLQRQELATTAITLFELTAGPRTTTHQLELLHGALAPVPVLPLTRGSADIAAAAHRALGRRGRAIALPDTLIASICIEAGWPLLTRNLAHFERLCPYGLELLKA